MLKGVVFFCVGIKVVVIIVGGFCCYFVEFGVVGDIWYFQKVEFGVYG